MCLLKTCCWVCYVQHIIQVVISTYISQKFQEILLRAQCKIKYFFLQAFHLGQVAGAAAGMVSCMYVHIGAKALVNVNQCTCIELLCNVVSQRMYVYVLAPQMLWPGTCMLVGTYRISGNFRPPEIFGLEHQYENYKCVCTIIVHFSLVWKNLSNNSHLYSQYNRASQLR